MTPPICRADVFDQVDKETCQLIVPDQVVDTYATTYPWNLFMNIRGENGTQTGIEVYNKIEKSFTIYNMNGSLIKITEDWDDVMALPSGIYIVNNKKIKI